MAQVKLPVVILVALLSAVAGGAMSYVAFPTADPEMKALLARHVALAEEEAAARAITNERTRKLMNSNPDDYPTTGGQKMAPRW
ncbi:hypothetical protein DSM25558_3274 [Agrobacterium sp. DSM 25558]|uniref:DUF2749 domain-containing protein n=1 Tax=Agrobacterium sp. DSM 25558 TaxID=1907665 RepID=UPI00097244AA|nr:DUF2749 domain-containing protein [Agrobacterium sp. DSM 25558]SCX23015.1 hypothetical protein DSM25558_3274 [Agrobacterium sp. DSM 25558]